MKCPNCSKALESKEGTKKLCAQIGNPDIAIVKTTNPKFCSTCNDYFLSTDEMKKSIQGIKKLSESKKEIEEGVYS